MSQEVAAEEEWKEKLHRLLTRSLSPAAFERLVQRLLRESGFSQVEVRGPTGVECPVLYVPVSMRETGAKGAGNGARKEAYS